MESSAEPQRPSELDIEKATSNINGKTEPCDSGGEAPSILLTNIDVESPDISNDASSQLLDFLTPDEDELKESAPVSCAESDDSVEFTQLDALPVNSNDCNNISDNPLTSDDFEKKAPHCPRKSTRLVDTLYAQSDDSLDNLQFSVFKSDGSSKDDELIISPTVSPFVVPRRMVGREEYCLPGAIVKQSSPDRDKKSNGRSECEVPRYSHKQHASDYDDENTVTSDDVNANSDAVPISAPVYAALEEPQLRRRSNWKGRSSSSDPVNSGGGGAGGGVEGGRSGGRKRSLSRDRRACCSPDASKSQLKCDAILAALDAATPDVATLRQLAISRGGLLDDSLRRRAWPALLNIDVHNIRSKPAAAVYMEHRDYRQVLMDVNRSAKRFPPGMLEEIRLSYQDQLIECIMWVLVYHDELHYYQGFHDVVVTFLLVVGDELTFAIMDKLVENHFRDFMEKTMEKTNYMLNYLLPIIGKASPKLRTFMEKSEVGNMFCLSWLITWFGHALSDFRDIVRLYDFFIACDPLMPIYLAADIVLYRESEVLACDCDMPAVHSLLQRIPEDLPFELLISRAGDLFVQYPPDTIEAEAREQYDAFVQAIERRRLEAAAQREALRAVRAARSHPSTAVARHPRTSLMVKMSVWTLVGAVSAIAFTVYKNNALLDWRSWMWA